MKNRFFKAALFVVQVDVAALFLFWLGHMNAETSYNTIFFTTTSVFMYEFYNFTYDVFNKPGK